MTYRLGRFGLPTNNQVLWCISNNFNVWKIPYCKHEVITWVMFSCDVQFNRLIDGSVDDVWSVNSWGERCCEEDKKIRSYSQEYVFKRTEIFQEMHGSVHATWCIIPKWQGSNKNSCQSMPWNRQIYLITLIVLYFLCPFMVLFPEYVWFYFPKGIASPWNLAGTSLIPSYLQVFFLRPYSHNLSFYFKRQSYTVVTDCIPIPSSLFTWLLFSSCLLVVHPYEVSMVTAASNRQLVLFPQTLSAWSRNESFVQVMLSMNIGT